MVIVDHIIIILLLNLEFLPKEGDLFAFMIWNERFYLLQKESLDLNG